MQYKLLATADQAEGQLDSGIGASTLSIVLKSGEGALMPVIVRGSTTSLGSATLLNKTGIGASGIEVGDFIENITDGSHAFVLTVNTDSLTTTNLRGGSDNLWQSADVYAVGRFVLTLNKRNSSGSITASEKVLIGNISGDILTVETGGRGYDSTTPAAFDADDYASLFVARDLFSELKKAYAEAFEEIDNRYTKAEIASLFDARKWKDEVICATTSARTLATDFEAGDVIDGVTLTVGSRVLNKDAADAKENGIYIVAASGAPTRAADFDTGSEISSSVTPVRQGTSNANLLFFCSSDNPTIGVDNITFSQVGAPIEKATNSDIDTGTDDSKFITVAKLLYFFRSITSAIYTAFVNTRTAITALATDDYVLLGDHSDSDKDKKMLISDFQKSLQIVGQKLTASNNLLGERIGGSTFSGNVFGQPFKLRSLWGGTVRIKFAIGTSNLGCTTIYGRIYVNGVAVGTIRSTTSATPVEFSEDITINPNDEIAIYSYANTNSYYYTLSYIRAYADKTVGYDFYPV